MDVRQELLRRFAASLPEYYTRRIVVFRDDQGGFAAPTWSRWSCRRAHPHHAGERVVHPAAADRERLRAGEYSALLPEDVCALAG